MDSVMLFLDSYLIQLYRMTGNSYMDFLLGTFLLALLAVCAGE